MSGLAAFGKRLWRGRYLLVYLAVATALVAHLRHFYHPPTGFTSLIRFGSRFAEQRLPALNPLRIYTYADADGYDGQFYAQLAVAGNPFDPAVAEALDSAAYRSRRVLLPLASYVAGLGRPAWVLEVYALANPICWLLLAFLLARWWFPPTSLDHLLRWGGVLLGEGMLVSLTHGLTDGPALLLLAAGLRALERRRAGIAAALVALGGLVRDTGVLAAAAFVPLSGDDRRGWRRNALLLAVCALPLLCWVAALRVHYDAAGGLRNFDVPFAAIAAKVRELHGVWSRHGFDGTVRRGLWAVVSLALQAGFLLLRPRPRDAVWRVGAAFALLWCFLGEAVWEGGLSAAPRVLLPLTLAFNLLVPGTRAGLILLVAGNLTVLSAADVLKPRPSEQTIFPHRIGCAYSDGWHGPETEGTRTWRWASGPATMRFANAGSEPREAEISFRLVSVVDREVRLRAANIQRIFRVPGGGAGVTVRLPPLRLPPGETPVSFSSDTPPWIEPGGGRRPLAFAVEDLYADVSPAAGR